MKLLNEYKGVILLYLGLAVLNVVFMFSVESPAEKKEVSNPKNIVVKV